jgi:hypothetical protein
MHGMSPVIWPEDDTARVVAALLDNGVRFLVIGGAAVRMYCPVRQPRDLDFLVDPRSGRLSRIRSALEPFGCVVGEPWRDHPWQFSPTCVGHPVAS